MTNQQHNLPAFAKRIAYPSNREGVADHFEDRVVRKTIAVDLALLDRYDDTLLVDLESYLVRQAKQHDAQAFQLLRSIPGVGKVLALTILYEIHDVKRFDRVQEFASYARLVKCAKESAGKKHGTSGAKMGNVHLKWAFSEAAVLFVRHSEPGKELLARLEKRHGKGKALSILAHKLGRAAYYMLLRGKAFEIERFVATVNLEWVREPVVQREPHGSSSNETASSPCAYEREKASVIEPKIRQLARLIGHALSLPLSTSRLDCLRLCPSPSLETTDLRGRRHEEAGMRERMGF